MKYFIALFVLLPFLSEAQFDLEMEETVGVPPIKDAVFDRMKEGQQLTDHIYVIDVLIRTDVEGEPLDTLVLYTGKTGSRQGPIYFAQSGDWSTYQEIPKNEDFDPYYYSITGLRLRESEEKSSGVIIVKRDDWYADVTW